MTQFSIPCSVYRGGTSRGLFFHEKDLPQDETARNNIFLQGIDAYNLSQINGLGSGTSHSSKVVVIGTTGEQINYTFYQIGIGTPTVDDKGTCGNLMAAVGAFVVNEGLIDVDPTAKEIKVPVYNTNVNMHLHINIPVENGEAKVVGDYLMPGIVTSGAKFEVDILRPGGGKTGKTLPLGLSSAIKNYQVSFVDVVNPFVFVAADMLGLSGTEPIGEVSGNEQLMKEVNGIRDEAAVSVGFAETIEGAKTNSPAIPKISIVAKAQDYITTSGKQIKKEEIDIVAKMLSMGKVHRTFAGSGLYNLAATTLLPGTIPNQVAGLKNIEKNQIIRIGHPDGIAEVRVSLTEDQKDVLSVGLDRTARQIMKGEVFIPKNVERL